MEQPQQNSEQSLEPGQAAAKTAILAQCDQLAAAGVTFVAVHFDGYGDDGTTEEVKCYDSVWRARARQIRRFPSAGTLRNSCAFRV